MNPSAIRFFSVVLCLAAQLMAAPGARAAAASPPNLLLVMADDLGFSDLGCYGSEIPTPTVDRLASQGVRFTQFYNTAKCHSSRVSLLTGRWCIQAGDRDMTKAVTLPEVLQGAGYFTAMTGKWHLAKQPTNFGFQRYFGHLSGATNYYLGDNSYRLNGTPWEVPTEGFYSTVANVDHALRFVGEARAVRKPWFLYIAFNAPHAPLQPLEEDYKRHLGRYDAGWDAVNAARFSRQKQLGLFPASVVASPRPEHIPAWGSLPPETRAWEAKRMAAYAALVDRVDRELGRLVTDLERAGELANTLILFVSDNGASPYDRRPAEPEAKPYSATTRWGPSTGWAWASNTPFRFYKQNQFEGGIASPAVVHWPNGIKLKAGSFVHSPAHLVDVLPTFAEAARARIPDTWPGRTPTPLAGVSLAPTLAGRPAGARPPIHLLFSTDRGLRDGDWKIVSFHRGPWELYNLAKDRTELHDVSRQHPEIATRMVAQWHAMAENVLGVPAEERQPVSTVAAAKAHPEWSAYADAGGEKPPRKKKERKKAKQ